MKQQAKTAPILAEYGPACSQLDFAPNTDRWRNYVLRLALKNDSSRVSTAILGDWGSGGMV